MNLKNLMVSTVLLSMGAGLALAQPVSYDVTTTRINAGVLLIESQRTSGVTYSPAPHAWGQLDRNTSVKPGGWTFVNPLGRTELTNSDANRWVAIAGSAPAAGTQLRKNAAPYWEVPLESTNDASLAQFDVLLLSVNGFLSLNSIEREKLRKFVDQGGTLWVDIVPEASVLIDFANPLPLGFDLNTDGSAVSTNPDHPLLSQPNRITVDDVRLVEFGGQAYVTSPLAGFGALQPVLNPIASTSRWYEPVAGTASGLTISVGKVGQGQIVLTSRGASAVLNRGVNPSTPGTIFANRGFFSLAPVPDTAYLASAKLALNIVSLATNFTSSASGSRRTGSTPANLSAPLLRKFTETYTGSFTASATPGFSKGIMVVVGGGRVRAFDAQTGRDLNGDGFADDGVSDPLDAQGDLLWESAALGGALSAPTIVEASNTTLGAPDQVWVNSANGTVYVFDLFANGTNVAPLTTVIPATAGTAATTGPAAPTVQDGIVLITDVQGSAGRVWAIDLNTAQQITTTNPWAITGSPRLASPSATSSMAYIPIQDGSGGVDRVIYTPTAPSGAPTPRGAGLASLWLGSRGESPIDRRLLSATQMSLTTRASLQGLPVVVNPAAPLAHLGVKVTMLLPSGDPMPLNDLTQYLDGTISQGANGEIRLGLTGSNPLALDLDGSDANPNNDVGWRLDYTIDWGRAGGFGGVPADSFVRGNVEFSDTASNSRRLVGAPAVGPEGNVFVVTTDDGFTPGATLFNLRESGRGDFVLVYRWDLYSGFQMTVNGATQNVAATVDDNDELVSRLGFLDRPLLRWSVTTPPSVRGDQVFLAARAIKALPFGPGANSETTVMFALRANPGPLEFTVNTAIPDNASVTLRQPDISRSTNKTAPEVISTIPAGAVTVQRQSNGTARILLDSAMVVRRGRIADSLSSSLPVLVNINGQSDAYYEPEAAVDAGAYFAGQASGRFSPLLWYAVLNGLDPQAGPVVAGDTAYVGGSSVLPGLLTAGFSFPLARNGLMFGFDINVATNDPFLVNRGDKPWMSQLSTIDPNNGTWTQPTAVRWPQTRGVRDFDDLRIRLLQATIVDANVNGLAVGSGTLAVQTPDRIHAFSRADVWVADEGRVARFDGAGNPLWAADSTRNSGADIASTSASREMRLSEPTRAYNLGDGTVGLVDSGNNRIVRVDTSGREIRTITGFRVDPNWVPNGFTETVGRTLRSPRDVLIFETDVQAIDNPFSNAQPLERWVHYLIADTGNSRAVELVDRYQLDAATGRVGDVVGYNSRDGAERALGVLFWHSPEELSAKRYAYNSISRVTTETGTGRRVVVAFGFGNVEPGRATFGLDTTGQQVDRNSGFGGVVIYDGQQTVVINEFVRPAIQAGSFLAETSPGVYTFALPAANQAARTQNFVGLTSATLRYVDDGSGPNLAVMVTDATGVYELVRPDPVASPNGWAVRWMLPREAYVGMRRPRDNADRPTAVSPINVNDLDENPRGFRPTYARRLDSGDVLIVNGFFGTRFNNRQFNGEVVIVDGGFGGSGNRPGYSLNRWNLGFNALSVTFELPPVQGIRGIVNPTFAETN